MTEQEETDTLEDLTGSSARAFRLMRLWTGSANLGTAYDRLFNKQGTQIGAFTQRARQDGYSDEAIQFYVEVIQGQG